MQLHTLALMTLLGGIAGAYLIGGTGYFFVSLLKGSSEAGFQIGTVLMILGFLLGSGMTFQWLTRRSTFRINLQRLKKIS